MSPYSAPNQIINILLSKLPDGLLINLGAGRTSNNTASKRVIGVDLEIPQSYISNYVLGDATRLPFRDEIFDGCLLKDIIEHVLDPVKAMRELRRISKQGATAILITPRAIPRAVWADPTHIRGFTLNSLYILMKHSGWTIISKPTRYGGFPGASRFNFERHLELIMRIPILGHYFGTNWICEIQKI